MKAYEWKKKVMVEGIKDFNLKHTFECGQCFRWKEEEDGSYTGVAFNRVVNVSMKEKTLTIKNTNLNDYHSIWKHYFDLERDYSAIKQKLRKDPVLKEAVEFGWGIRILQQDIWECIISFIISSNNIIPRIKKIIENLSEKYGQPVLFGDKVYYGFPSPKDLYGVIVEDLAFLKAGYRDKFIVDAVQKVCENNISLDRLRNMPTADARKELMRIKGVGNKVADCILLFSLQKYDVFPTDVWIRRVMQHYYLGEDATVYDVQKYSSRHYGNLGGFAQQYLFYYARERKIGRKD